MTPLLGAMGGPWGMAASGALMGVGQLGRIGQGRRAANDFTGAYEDKLGKQILPQVIAMMQAGNTEGAKQLLQTGVSDYYNGVQQYQSAGGNYGKVASQSISNKALQDTISSISNQLGFQYTPGVGLTGGQAMMGQGAVAGTEEGQQMADLYGLKAPVKQGDPFAMQAPQVKGSDLLNNWLQGQGYDAKSLAQMHAGATEGVARQGVTEMSQVKRAMGQAGMFGQPGYASVVANMARNNGQQQIAANRDVDLKNAEAALGNQRAALPMDLQQKNLQTQYDWNAQKSNFDELNSRYKGALGALQGY